MKKYILTNTVFNVSREYDSMKQIKVEIGLSYHLMENMLETGEAKHGYTLDIMEVDNDIRDKR